MLLQWHFYGGMVNVGGGGRCCFNDNDGVWATVCGMGHCVCYGPLGVKWATLCVMGHCMFYGPLGVLGSPRNVVE